MLRYWAIKNLGIWFFLTPPVMVKDRCTSDPGSVIPPEKWRAFCHGGRYLFLINRTLNFEPCRAETL